MKIRSISLSLLGGLSGLFLSGCFSDTEDEAFQIISGGYSQIPTNRIYTMLLVYILVDILIVMGAKLVHKVRYPASYARMNGKEILKIVIYIIVGNLLITGFFIGFGTVFFQMLLNASVVFLLIVVAVALK